MSTMGKLLAPKPIRRPFNVVNTVNSTANNNPKKSSVNIYRYSTKQSKAEIIRSSQLAYLNTSSTLRESELFFSNIESDLEQECCRNEICSILTQQDDNIPFTLCDDECQEEPQDVERVKNPFEKNFELSDEREDDSDVVCPFSKKLAETNDDEGRRDDLL